MDNIIKIKTHDIDTIKSSMPDEDYIATKYDIDNNIEPENILIIFSTPRSGSTLLCNILYDNNICLAHEYIQPFQYLPILADRWGCIERGVLDNVRYIKYLYKYRTSINGWLGINAHGSHIDNLLKLKDDFGNKKIKYIYLRREKIIEQAVSYEIARQTRQWSSYFSPSSKPVYSFDSINKKIDQINYQNTLIESYLNRFNIDYIAISYEDLVSDSKNTIDTVTKHLNINRDILYNPALMKQANTVNLEWVKKYSAERLGLI